MDGDGLFGAVRDEAQAFFSDARGSHDWEHTERVYALCMSIGREEGADLDVLRFAAVLHDVGRGFEDESKGRICHAKKGAAIAREVLLKHGVDDGKVDEIVHCIECHRFRGGKVPISLEAKVLFDADKLDSIGAVGVGRAFLFAGEVGARLHNGDVDVLKTEAYSREDTAYREFMVKLRKVKERMLTSSGRRMALGRHRFMVEFFEVLDKEVRGDL